MINKSISFHSCIPCYFINIDVPIDLTESKNKIMDHIIESLHTDNNGHYVEHEEASNTFKIMEEPEQTDKVCSN